MKLIKEGIFYGRETGNVEVFLFHFIQTNEMRETQITLLGVLLYAK